MTLRLKKLPIFGEGIYSKSAVVTRQRRLNCYLEIRKDDDKSSIVAYGTPGLQLAFNASTPQNSPARGLVGNDSALYEVAGDQVLSLSQTGQMLASAMLGTISGSVGMALNPTQLLIVDGSAGYIFTTSAVAVVFTGDVAGGATSATLLSPWGSGSTSFPVTFSDGEIRQVTLTNNATTATWSKPLTGNVTATASIASGSIISVGASFPNGALTAAYCNGFFICEDPGTNQFFVSALNDGTNWPGLSFAAAVQAIDGIAAIDTLGGLLIIFTFGHIEFWQNVGGVPEPFQYIQNSATMYGIAAIFSRAHLGDSLVFLAHTGGGSFQNSAGAVQVCMIKGYTVQVISTSDIDNIIQVIAATSTIADATAFSYQIDSHQFYQINFPSGNRSLLYDVTTNLWSEVQSGITAGYAARHLGNLGAQAFNQTWIADYSNGNLYNFNPKVYTDNGNTIVRKIVTRCAIADFNVFRCGAIYFDMATGVGLPNKGYGYNPMVSLSCARDNRDFSAPRLLHLGKSGQYITRVFSRRWGKGRQMNFDLTMTDPVEFTVTAGAALISQRTYRGRKAA